MNVDFKQKYLKYKTKYNELKHAQEGGIGGLDSGELRAYFLTQEQLELCIENQENKKKQKIVKEYIDINNNKIQNFVKEKLCESKEVKIHIPTRKMRQTHVLQKKDSQEKTIEQSNQPDILLRQHFIPGVASFQRWRDRRKQEKKVTKNTIDAAKCNDLITENQNLMKQYNNLQDKMYDGNNKKCNFNLYGMNLYEKSPRSFKLESIAPYCVQNSKFVYYMNRINDKNISDKQEFLHEAFDYTNQEIINKYLTEIKTHRITKNLYQNTVFKYIIIVRSYRNSFNPDILVSVYKIEGESINAINPTSKWETVKTHLNLQINNKQIINK